MYTNIQNPPLYLEANAIQTLKRISKNVIIGIGAVASYITIENELKVRENIDNLKTTAQKVCAEAKKEVISITNNRNSENFVHKIKLTKMENSLNVLHTAIDKDTELQKQIRARKII